MCLETNSICEYANYNFQYEVLFSPVESTFEYFFAGCHNGELHQAPDGAQGVSPSLCHWPGL